MSFVDVVSFVLVVKRGLFLLEDLLLDFFNNERATTKESKLKAVEEERLRKEALQQQKVAEQKMLRQLSEANKPTLRRLRHEFLQRLFEMCGEYTASRLIPLKPTLGDSKSISIKKICRPTAMHITASASK